MLPPPQNPNQYSPACILFLKFSLGSQRFTISGRKSRRFHHNSSLLPFVSSARRSLPTRVRAIATKLLPTRGVLRSFDPAKTAPVWGLRLLRIYPCARTKHVKQVKVIELARTRCENNFCRLEGKKNCFMRCTFIVVGRVYFLLLFCRLVSHPGSN